MYIYVAHGTYVHSYLFYYRKIYYATYIHMICYVCSLLYISDKSTLRILFSKVGYTVCMQSIKAMYMML